MGYIYLVPIQKVESLRHKKGKYPILYDVNENNQILGILEIFHATLCFPDEIRTIR